MALRVFLKEDDITFLQGFIDSNNSDFLDIEVQSKLRRISKLLNHSLKGKTTSSDNYNSVSNNSSSYEKTNDNLGYIRCFSADEQAFIEMHLEENDKNLYHSIQATLGAGKKKSFEEMFEKYMKKNNPKFSCFKENESLISSIFKQLYKRKYPN